MAGKPSSTVLPRGAALPAQQDSVTAGDDLGTIVGDPALARTLNEDPVLRFLVTTWRGWSKQVLIAVIAVAVVFYFVKTFRETREHDIETAGDAFFQVQHDFDAFRMREYQLAQLNKRDNAATDDKIKKQIADLEKEKSDIKRRLDDALTALADAREPYNKLAAFYRGLLAREGGDMKGLTAAVNPHAWEDIKDTKSSERIFAELEALAYARGMLDTDTGINDARALLKQLALNGAYVHVTAALAFSATAQAPQERAEALELLNQVQTAHPEQEPLLRDEIGRLKG